MPGPKYQPKPFVSSTAGHFIAMPSPSIDERGLGEIPAGDYPGELAKEACRNLRLAAESSYQAAVAIHADMTLPEGARHVQADAVSLKATGRALPIADHAHRAMETEIAKLKLKISAPPVDSTPKGIGLASEIRQALKSMAAGERRTAIAKGISDGDDSIVGAIATAPGMLTGLSPVEVSTYVGQWSAKKFPAEIARLRDLEKKLAFLEKAGSLLIGYQRTMSAGAILQEAKKFQQASADAQRAALGVSH
jgi:hypothetical protein